jgi:hypothetical protein
MRSLLALMIFGAPAFGQEIGDRSISGAEVWRAAEGRHMIRGVVTIEEGASLTIEPGTAVEFAPDFRSGIVVRGRLIAVGSPGEPITIGLVGGNRADATAKWRGVWIDSPNAIASLWKVLLSDAIVGVEVSAGSVELADSTVRRSVRAVLARGETSDLLVTHSTIEENTFGVDGYADSRVAVRDSILRNNRTAVYFTVNTATTGSWSDACTPLTRASGTVTLCSARAEAFEKNT